MANPKLPGIPEAEQALLYAKLNEYNRGRMSYKEAGAYFVVLPRPGHPTYSVWVYSPSLGKEQTSVYPRAFRRHQRIITDGKYAVFLLQTLSADRGIQ